MLLTASRIRVLVTQTIWVYIFFIAFSRISKFWQRKEKHLLPGFKLKHSLNEYKNSIELRKKNENETERLDIIYLSLKEEPPSAAIKTIAEIAEVPLGSRRLVRTPCNEHSGYVRI